MKNLLYLFLFIASFCFSQDSASYFNKTLPKNTITGTIGGETVFFSLGYEKCIGFSKKTRYVFSTKIGPGSHSGFAMPVGILAELFENKNKLFCGIYLGSKINPFGSRFSTKHVREIEDDPQSLKTPPNFIYVPYSTISLGYKRYFNKRHAVSLFGNFGIYPTFEYYNPTPYDYKARLILKPMIWGGVSYYRLF